MEQLGDFVKERLVGTEITLDIFKFKFNDGGVIITVDGVTSAYPYTTPVEVKEEII